MREFDTFDLPNGIRVVHKQVTNTRIVHCGFILDVGSRDEKPEEQGIAHFWEHMAFKGTKKRKAFHIINRLESVGGELNAYTTKEKICFYASVLENYFEKAFELLTDITFDSVFPVKQIEKERKVILEEMSMYYDSPDDAIQDEFDDLIFSGHPLGKNILGTAESVKSFNRKDFKEFIHSNLNTERLIFTSVGNFSIKKIKFLAAKYLENKPAKKTFKERVPFQNYIPKEKIVNRSLTQAHCAIGNTAYPLDHKNRLPFFMLVNILGGPGLNSRLNLALREKYGFVYSVDATYNPYSDTGLFGVFFGTEPGQLDKSIKIVMRELNRLKNNPLGSLQLHRAKEQLMGQLAMAEENNTALMLMMGKSLLDLNKIESLDDIFRRIKKIQSSDLQHIANEIFEEKELSVLKFLPNE